MSKKRLQRAKTISFRARQTYITPIKIFMVEVSGTAPESDTPITYSVYCYS